MIALVAFIPEDRCAKIQIEVQQILSGMAGIYGRKFRQGARTLFKVVRVSNLNSDAKVQLNNFFSVGI